jgi:DNA-binding NtrC family response regulator
MLQIICVTKERDCVSHLREIFPDLEMNVAILDDLKPVLDPSKKLTADVLIVDLELLTAEQTLIELLDAAFRKAQRVVAILPINSNVVHGVLQERGVVVLHKPLTFGEITLGLTRALRNLHPLG